MWSLAPEEALSDTRLFLAHAMVYGLWQDVEVLFRRFSLAELRDALCHAPAGLFDIRSWHYWHKVVGLEVPTLPRRNLPGNAIVPATSKADFHQTKT